ncbi:MAG: peptide-binding protein, partial [Candidatus Hydrogenedentota bacterium]
DEIDRLLEEARLEFDDQKRAEIYHRYHEVIHDEQPYIFLYMRPGLIAVDKRFHGINNKKGGMTPLDWWVPKEDQKYTSTN